MPSAAERTRTLVQSTCSAVLIIPGADEAGPDELMPEARTVGTDGAVFLLFPAGAPPVRAATHAQDDELPVVLELTDVAPVAVPHRIRGRAWVSGWLTCAPGVAEPGYMMLRLEVGEVYLDDLWGDATVGPEDFAEAVPDPLTAYETELLQHLAAVHDDHVQGLSGLLGQRTDVRRVVPLALDRFGLRVRCRDAAGCSFDARFDFPEPVGDIHGLRRAMHALFEAAGPAD
ncbi:hypothetical protein AMK26_28670 [Streptomyces sp. CB03234]|uniref:DUF2470 domain-containing protein n=1 Tax=Streptomyces sp. (strain CB03234) TaxID=1703937 RepID=UPI00093FA410|nr:DUF2470 domain-containing protein [Streptomyces sp. CB03234]OKJ96829.1 hypothetical protein AMK26_28670 [Streptomyces sp. CB03234]